jgi:hypothetical protein
VQYRSSHASTGGLGFARDSSWLAGRWGGARLQNDRELLRWQINRKKQLIDAASFEHTFADLPKRWESDPVGAAWGDWGVALKRVSKFTDPKKREQILTVQARLFQQSHATAMDVDVIKAGMTEALELSD